MADPGSNPPAVVELEKLTFSFGHEPVLRDISLTVTEREFVVIVGKSGSGKSTLLRIIDGLLTGEGRVRVQGRVRMVFQEDRLFPWYRVRQNVAIAVTRDGTPPGESAGAGSASPRLSGTEKAMQLLEELGMRDLAHRYPHQLSGGERQRVAIARAFVARPQIVLMDEPFGALDVLTREHMQTWLLDFWQRNTAAVVFVTHDVEEALILGDRILVIVDGQLRPVLNVGFPRPRPRKLRYAPEFLEAKQRVREQLAD